MQRNRYRLVAFYFAMTLPVLLSGGPVAQETGKNAECTSIRFEFSLPSGKSFHQDVGDLAFVIRSDTSRNPPNGWTFSLEDAHGRDFIAPVNLPLRFNPSQILGPGYGLTAGESMKLSRELRFLLRDSDYSLVDPLWRDALWPYSAPDPDHAADKYISALARLPLGLLQLNVAETDISSNDLINSAKIAVNLTAPASFHFNGSLTPRPSACPAPVSF